MLQERYQQPARKPQDFYTVPSDLLKQPPDTSVKLNFEPYTKYGADYVRRERNAITVGKFAMTSILLFNAVTAPYLADVRLNMVENSDAKPTIQEIYPALSEDDKHKATIYFDGFNTSGARYLANVIGPSVQQAFGGEGWAVQYNNAVLNAAELSKLVHEKIDTKNNGLDEYIDAVDVVAHSMGVDPAVKFIEDSSNEDWANIENTVLISVPSDYDSLTPKTKSELDSTKNFAWIPWIEHSSWARYALEWYFYKEDIQKNPFGTVGGINTRFNNGGVTSNEFLISQIKSVTNSNIAESIGNLDEDAFRTTISYIEISNDNVVNNSDAAEKICKAALAKHLNCNVYKIKSTHGGYYLPETQEEFDRIFKEIAEFTGPLVAAEKARHALETDFSYYQQDTMLTLESSK